MTETVKAQREAHQQQRRKGEVIALATGIPTIIILWVILPLMYVWFYVPKHTPDSQEILYGVGAWCAWAAITVIAAIPFIRKRNQNGKD